MWLLLAILAGSACYDLKEHRIPNWWLLSAFFCGLALTALGAEEGRAGAAAAGYILRVSASAAVLFPLFALRMIGAGDIKLVAVMIGFLGFRRGVPAAAWGCVVGAVFSLVKLLAQGKLWQRLMYLLVYLRRLFRTKEIVPYYQAERDGYGVVIPFAVCLFAGYVGYFWSVR